MNSISKFSKSDILSKTQISDLYGGKQKIETENTVCCYGFCSETVYDVTNIYDDGSTSTRIRLIKSWWNSL